MSYHKIVDLSPRQFLTFRSTCIEVEYLELHNNLCVEHVTLYVPEDPDAASFPRIRVRASNFAMNAIRRDGYFKIEPGHVMNDVYYLTPINETWKESPFYQEQYDLRFDPASDPTQYQI